MLSRGIIIGKIIDDLSILEQQISLRNKLGLFDLTKVSEDFFREVLNITYDLTLKNLNATRSNVAGIDLGDEVKKIAFQVTSQRTSEKINETLGAITNEHLKTYSHFKVLIIGRKQATYSLDKTLTKKFNFIIEENIIDMVKLLRDIVVLDIENLTSLFNLFKTEFRTVKIELEPVDSEGNYESSAYNSAEKRPASPPKNALKFIENDSSYKKEFNKLLKLYSKLADIPKSTREIIFFIVDRGKYITSRRSGYRVNPKILEKIFNFSENDLLNELNILDEEGLVSLTDDFIEERRVWYFAIHNSTLNDLLYWLNENNYPIRTILNTMDFTFLDE